ncbi:MAG: acetyltransferase, partial [Proteobacteria bacterium]|nr:acetyltransferase [Pseudomonadota bacterium]
MDKIILIGAGGHAKACIDIIERDERFGIVGLVDKRESIVDNILGYKVIGTDDDLENLHLKYVYAFVTVGQIKTPEIRI